jgi:hypothetical protein
LRFNKRFFLIFALIGIIFVAFLPALGLMTVRAVQPALVQATGCQQCGTISYSGAVTSGNLLVFAFNQVAGTSCDVSGVLSDSLGNSFFRLFTISSPGYSSDQICAYYVVSAFSGSDTITLQATENSAVAFELFDFTVNGSQNVQGGNSISGSTGANTWNYHASSSLNSGVLTVELASAVATNGATYQGTLTATSGFTVLTGASGGTYPASFGAYLFGQAGSNQNFPISLTTTVTSPTGVGYDVVGFSLVALNPYNPYATTVVTYPITWSNSVCLPGSPDCTNVTGTLTIPYDSTTTTVVTTTCSISDSGGQYCVTATTSTNKTVTYTDTSASIVTDTVTTTTTATAVLAPTQESLLYWFFGFVALLLPPATLVGIRANSGSGGEDFIPLILIGLFVGALLGLILNVLPWEFLVVFGAILALYVIRGRF